MEHNLVEIQMTDRLKHCTETITGPDPSPGPDLVVQAIFSPEDQILSTIDSDALLTTASPEEEDDDEDLGECKMKMTPHQELKNSSSCVLLERQRRKRITQSCSMLRQLLPTLHGSSVNMVMVLKTTVAFLETVQELLPTEDPKVQLCPPAKLHAKWLLQCQESRELGYKMAAEQQEEEEEEEEEEKQQLNRREDVLLQRMRSRRQADRQVSLKHL